jgi:pimeloyl-ACP methyl ester carboxylesterase
VVNDVLDRMGIQHCSILAHSAGAPYAMSFANLYPERVKGDVCLLAPWVGGGESCMFCFKPTFPNAD